MVDTGIPCSRWIEVLRRVVLVHTVVYYCREGLEAEAKMKTKEDRWEGTEIAQEAA